MISESDEHTNPISQTAAVPSTDAMGSVDPSQTVPAPRALHAARDHHFRTDDLIEGLGKRSVSAGKIAIVSSAVSFVLQIGTLAVLGRLLDPFAFGLIGMVTAFTAFVAAMKDMGLSQASIQSDHSNHQNVSTMFWLNAAAGLLSAVLVVALGPLLANFYNQSELVAIAAAMGMVFFISGLSSQHIALMQRRFRHLSVAVISNSAQIFASVVAIVAAYKGAGYWSLVILPFAQGVFTLVAAWVTCSWRPGMPAWSDGVRSMLLFSLPLVGAELLGIAMRNVDNILIGKFAGAAELGFYVMAYRMLLFPIRQINGPIGTVTLPTFARLKDDPVRFKRMYEKAIAGICLAGMPVVGAAFASADAFLPLLLGDQWTESVNIFRALGLAALMATHNVAGGWAATATGHTDRRLKWALIGPPISIASYAIGGYYGGALGVALAFSLSEFFIRPIAFWYILKPTPVKLRDVQHWVHSYRSP
jgi:O-antigen/teichoic acid export membrane protein